MRTLQVMETHEMGRRRRIKRSPADLDHQRGRKKGDAVHLKYNTMNQKEQGQILYYRPYPAEARRRVHPVSVTLWAILAALILLVVVLFATGRAEETEISCWVLCQPGDHVNLRLEPAKGSKSVGWLECGESFQTDGENRDGWIRVLDAGDCECWIYSGYVVTEEPQEIWETMYVVARNQVACRRWVNGPQIESRPWLKNGREVQVFYIAEGWAVTNLGYVEAEWLEV